MKEELLGVKGDKVDQEYYYWMIKHHQKIWEYLPDYMKRPRWVNREIKIDEILKEDDV